MEAGRNPPFQIRLDRARLNDRSPSARRPARARSYRRTSAAFGHSRGSSNPRTKPPHLPAEPVRAPRTKPRSIGAPGPEPLHRSRRAAAARTFRSIPERWTSIRTGSVEHRSQVRDNFRRSAAAIRSSGLGGPWPSAQSDGARRTIGSASAERTKARRANPRTAEFIAAAVRSAAPRPSERRNAHSPHVGVIKILTKLGGGESVPFLIGCLPLLGWPAP